MKVISFLNNKGGVGRTTSCVNISGILSQEYNKKVLLIDFDPQGNSSKVFFNEIKEKGSFNIFKKENINSLIYKTKYDNLDIITANQNLSGLDLFLNNELSREKILKKMIDELSGYDYVIIDCSPFFNLATINALSASHYCIIPSQAELFSIQAFFQINKMIDLIKDDLNPMIENLGILITMYDKRLNLHNDIIRKLKDQNIPTFNSLIPRSVRLSESFLHNKIITDYKKESKGAIAYGNFVKELLERL